MTATIAEHAPGAVRLELRNQVRERFEAEYLRLRSVERPALLAMLSADDRRIDPVKVGRALTILDYQLASLQHFLGTVHDADSHDQVCASCCVLLDEGEGPQWFLLAELPFLDLRVIASDSALGRALLGARPGETAHYPTPAGVRMARVLAVESCDDRD